MRKSEKCYKIVDKKSNRLYGAFPLTDDGHLAAKKYLRKLKDKNLKIIEK
jgi:hypothetical protein